MGMIRGCVQVPYGRRGVSGPRQITIGGDWPFVECRVCGNWLDPHTGEHAKTVDLRELMDAEEKRLQELSENAHKDFHGPK